MRRLRLGLPKGSLQEATVNIFQKAGFFISLSERSYFPSVDDEEIDLVLFRAQEIPRYVEEGVIDAGISGKDWIMESNAEVEEIVELRYSKRSFRPVRWVLAVNEGSEIRSVKDLEGKRICTELVEVTRRYLSREKVRAKVEFSWGATEVKPPLLADAIVEATETGESLRANNLRVIETLLESTPRLIANKIAYRDEWKRKKIKSIALLLEGAIFAMQRVGLKMNVPAQALEQVLKLLPALKKPTISSLSEKNWFAIETVVEEKVAREIIPRLKQAGAEGIIEYSLNKVIL
ncbi:MAG: ATP phosphoribosyltransferase [Candidatus Omnitrophota bacterium]|nr:MAG: ATP phosphoribosyltransferase [Candidatus Omnitrophota bacterium]